MDNQSALPTPMQATQSAPQEPLMGSSPDSVAQQYGAQTQGSLDALSRATNAINGVIPQTSQNPAARLQAIAEIKAAYIKEQFGVDVSQ